MEYGTWTAILHRIAGTLNEGSIACPHPMTLSTANLRDQGIWLPADVEMALFAYASARIGERK